MRKSKKTEPRSAQIEDDGLAQFQPDHLEREATPLGHLNPKKLTLVSLFAGAGGLDIGFESTGDFTTVVAADWAGYSIKTLETNKEKGHVLGLGSIAPWLSKAEYSSRHSKPLPLLGEAAIVRADLSEGSAAELGRIYGGPVDVVVGGPPCQAFSVRNRRADRGLMDVDGRGNLIFSFMEIVRDLRPRAFLFENVMGLDRSEHGNLVEKLVTFAREQLGYRVTISKVVASDFGLPQDRRRIVIVGTEPRLTFSPPQPTHGRPDLFDQSP